MKAPPFHTQVRRVELARQHLKAAAGLLLEARQLHRCEPALAASLTARYRAVASLEGWVGSVLSALIDAEQKAARP